MQNFTFFMSAFDRSARLCYISLGSYLRLRTYFSSTAWRIFICIEAKTLDIQYQQIRIIRKYAKIYKKSCRQTPNVPKMNLFLDGLGPLPVTDLTHIDLGNIDIILYKYPEPNPNFQKLKFWKIWKKKILKKKISKKNFEKYWNSEILKNEIFAEFAPRWSKSIREIYSIFPSCRFIGRFNIAHGKFGRGLVVWHCGIYLARS